MIVTRATGGLDLDTGPRPESNERIRDVMSWPAITVHPYDTAQSALAVAEELGVHHLPVTDDAEVMGILCTCHLRAMHPDVPVALCMETPAVTVGWDDGLDRAAALMRQHRTGCLIVTGRTYPGVVTIGDLVRAGVDMGDRPMCASCGSHHHVQSDAEDWSALCFECQQRGRGASR